MISVPRHSDVGWEGKYLIFANNNISPEKNNIDKISCLNVFQILFGTLKYYKHNALKFVAQMALLGIKYQVIATNCGITGTCTM